MKRTLLSLLLLFPLFAWADKPSDEQVNQAIKDLDKISARSIATGKSHSISSRDLNDMFRKVDLDWQKILAYLQTFDQLLHRLESKTGEQKFFSYGLKSTQRKLKNFMSFEPLSSIRPKNSDYYHFFYGDDYYFKWKVETLLERYKHYFEPGGKARILRNYLLSQDIPDDFLERNNLKKYLTIGIVLFEETLLFYENLKTGSNLRSLIPERTSLVLDSERIKLFKYRGLKQYPPFASPKEPQYICSCAEQAEEWKSIFKPRNKQQYSNSKCYDLDQIWRGRVLQSELRCVYNTFHFALEVSPRNSSCGQETKLLLQYDLPNVLGLAKGNWVSPKEFLNGGDCFGRLKGPESADLHQFAQNCLDQLTSDNKYCHGAYACLAQEFSHLGTTERPLKFPCP